MSSPAATPASPPTATSVRLRAAASALELRDEQVFGPGADDLCNRFLERIFSVPDVQSVRIDRPSATARIQYREVKLGVADLLQRMATAIRGIPADPSARPETACLLPRGLTGPSCSLHRHESVVSNWEVVASRPGVATLRHDLIAAEPARARQIAGSLQSVAGVLGAEVRSRSGTLRIRFDPGRTSIERLLRIVDEASLAPAPECIGNAVDLGVPPVSFGMANTSVALAVITDFVAPPLWPLTAAVLVGSNLETFREAAGQLRRGELGLPVLYTGIAAVTLATGQFAPWAAMGWMMRFWKHRYQRELAEGKRRLLGELLQPPRHARLETADGAEFEVPAERLGPGDVLRVSAGETVPLDGQIIGGYGLVDERIVRGRSGLSRKQPDDSIAAGSLVLRGEFRVEVRPSRSPRRAALLAQAAVAAVTSTPGRRTPSLRGEQFADRFVAPTLAAAGAGLFVGGPPMALAIMRADYASGPGMAQPLETLRTWALASRQGVVLRDPTALDRLPLINVLLLDHHPSLEVPEPEVAGVRVFPGHAESQVLQYAASAFKDIDDERAPALHAACRSRRINLLGRIPIEYGNDLTFVHRDLVVKVGRLGSHGTSRDGSARTYVPSSERAIDSLMVGINGQIAGLIDFRDSERLKAAGALRTLRAHMPNAPAIGLVSGADDAKVRPLAAGLGVDFHRAGLSSGDLARLIRGCRRRNLKVAFVGNCLVRAAAAREADLAVALDESGLQHLATLDASILLLQPDLARLSGLSQMARDYRQRLRVAQRTAVIPNLACAGGAFFLGFSSLATVLITNLGTLCTYARTKAAFRQLERPADAGPRPSRRPAKLMTPPMDPRLTTRSREGAT